MAKKVWVTLRYLGTDDGSDGDKEAEEVTVEEVDFNFGSQVKCARTAQIELHHSCNERVQSSMARNQFPIG